ncbi:acyltransferase [Chitinophaga sp. 22536]|uniref:acyltransferase n=1 Tax=unclassified Chitinophaga TaxID=2619133 RepID=UPI003F87DF37
MYYKVFWILRAMIYKFVFKKIGSLSYLGKPVFLSGASRISIGRKTRIFPGVRMEATSKQSFIEIGDEVSIAQNVHITSGGLLIIEKNAAILANVTITNIDHVYTEIGVPIIHQQLLIKDTHIGPNCMIGAGAMILAGTVLGEQCIVGANAVVRGNFPPYSVIVGSPGVCVKRYDTTAAVWRATEKNGDFI